ncbi:hypothetical protein WR25_14565 [Diploscapter pachys]|uniref:Uncharacterized protein n=1 Tax=Diploscapter pachys TaxID=2018661 RepID=A0A2A2L513_9BILA|nr:hypothetical protein WR25_14565 [Diploscapter pachys]
MIWVVLYLLSRAVNRAKGIELGIAPIVLGLILTTCLVLWPLEAETHGEIQVAEGEKVPIDYIFIMRLALLVFLTVFTLALFYYLVKAPPTVIQINTMQCLTWTIFCLFILSLIHSSLCLNSEYGFLLPVDQELEDMRIAEPLYMAKRGSKQFSLGFGKRAPSQQFSLGFGKRSPSVEDDSNHWKRAAKSQFSLGFGRR